MKKRTAAHYLWSCILATVSVGIPFIGQRVLADNVGLRAVALPPTLLEARESGQPETTLFDLYLSDVYKGLILTTYAESWCEIQEPKDALDELPEIVNNREKVVEALTGKIVGKREVSGVGVVECDLRTFRINVKPQQDYVQAKGGTLIQRIPDPERSLSFEQAVSGAYSGTLKSDFSSAFTYRSLLSYGKFWGQLDGTAIQDRDYELNQLSASGIIDDYRVDLGLLRTEGLQFGGSAEFVGVGMETSVDIVTNQDELQGSRFEIFVPSRSRVEFYRADRLLSVQVLDFGLQQVETRNFPQGSYNVDVIIREDSGNVIRETKFFTKSGLLALRDEPVYSLQVGLLRKQLTVSDTPVYQAGMRYRLLSFLELGTSAYGTDELTIGQLSLTGLYRDVYFAGSFSSSTAARYGVSASVSGTLLGLNLGTSYSRTLNPDNTKDEPEQDETEPLPFIPPHKQDIFDLLSRKRSSTSASIGRIIGPVEFRVAGTRNYSYASRKRFAYGPSAEWRIFRTVSQDLALSTSYMRTEDGDKAAVMIAYSYSFGRWLSAMNGGLRNEQGSDRDLGRAMLTYDDRDRNERGTRASFSEEFKEVGQKKEAAEVSTVELFQGNEYAEGKFFARQSSQQSDDANIGVTGSTSMIVSGDGGISFSNPPRAEAVLVAEVVGAGEDSAFDVIVNEQTVGSIKGGGKVVTGLGPYRTYKIGIRPKQGSAIVHYDNSLYEVTVFPGNVVKKTWKFERVFIALGRLLDRDGRSIGWQRIKGPKEYVVTEDDGHFQAEITGSESLEIDSSKYHCKIELPQPQEAVQYFYDFGDVYCR